MSLSTGEVLDLVQEEGRPVPIDVALRNVLAGRTPFAGIRRLFSRRARLIARRWRNDDLLAIRNLIRYKREGVKHIWPK